MFADVAGALLMFTGLWHASEFMLDGRRRDTLVLIPVGLIYLLLGCLIVASIGGLITQGIALLSVIAGGSLAFINRNKFDIRKWVNTTFILIDIIIVVTLIMALFGYTRSP